MSIPETVSLPSEVLIEQAAELDAVETMLSRLWGHQEDGPGGLVERIGSANARLLREAFDDAFDETLDEVEAKAQPIIAKWLLQLQQRTASDARALVVGRRRDDA